MAVGRNVADFTCYVISRNGYQLAEPDERGGSQVTGREVKIIRVDDFIISGDLMSKLRTDTADQKIAVGPNFAKENSFCSDLPA